MEKSDLNNVIEQCQALIEERFGTHEEAGAAAMLTSDGTVLVGTAPDAMNPAVEVCHETEPYCAVYRLDQKIVASICLHRDENRKYLVLSPCGVCQERLAVHGPHVLTAVPGGQLAQWVPLKDLMPHYWATSFEDGPSEWLEAPAPS